MMTQVRDVFDRAKLQIERLNTIWSLQGDPFCPQIEAVLRGAVWNDRDPSNPIGQLHMASKLLRDRYILWNDSGMMNRSIMEWNLTLAHVQDMLRDLHPYMNRQLQRLHA